MVKLRSSVLIAITVVAIIMLGHFNFWTYSDEQSINTENDSSVIISSLSADSEEDINTEEITLDNPKVLHVKDFGALGDGITNDTEAFNKAISAMSDGYKLYVDEGTYLIDSLVIHKDNIIITGDENSLIVCNKIVNPFIEIGGKHVYIQSLNIDGARKAIRGINIIANSENVTIEECVVENIFDNDVDLEISAIKVYGDCKNIKIARCTINNVEATPDGIEGNGAGAARGIIVNPYLGNNEGNSTNIQINFNKISNIYPREDGDGVVIRTLDDIQSGVTTAIIKKNTFRNCSKRGIKLLGEGNIVTGNTIYNSFKGEKSNWLDGMYAGISVLGSNNTVTGNKIYGNSYYIPLNISGSNVNNIKIENNIVDVTHNDSVKPYLGGISFTGNSDNVYVTGNSVSGCYHGIYIRKQMLNASITDNVIDDSNTGYGIFIDDYKYIQINNIDVFNNIINSKLSKVVVEAGENIIVEYNQ